VRLRFADAIARRVDKNGIASVTIVVVTLGIVDTGCKGRTRGNQARDGTILGALQAGERSARSRVAILCSIVTVRASDALGRVCRGGSRREGLADSIARRVDKDSIAAAAIVIVALGIVDTGHNGRAGSNQTRDRVILGALQAGKGNAGPGVTVLRTIATVGASNTLGGVCRVRRGWGRNRNRNRNRSRSRSRRLADSIARRVDKDSIAAAAIVIVALGIVDTGHNGRAGSNQTRDRVILGALQTGKGNAGSGVTVLCPIATIGTRGTIGRAGSGSGWQWDNGTILDTDAFHTRGLCRIATVRINIARGADAASIAVTAQASSRRHRECRPYGIVIARSHIDDSRHIVFWSELRGNARDKGIGKARKEIGTAHLEINAARSRIATSRHNDALGAAKIAALVHSIHHDAKGG
jgi:hypothetical protein